MCTHLLELELLELTRKTKNVKDNVNTVSGN